MMLNKLLIFSFVILFNKGFCQVTVKDVLYFINSNNLTNEANFKFENDKIVNIGSDLSILNFSNESYIGNNKKTDFFKVLKGKDSQLRLSINDIYIANIYNYDVFKIVLFKGGNFMILDNKYKISLFVETFLKFNNEGIDNELKIKNIFGIDNKLLPVNVMSFDNDKILFTSYFRYDKKFVEEKIIISEESKNQNCDILNRNLNMVFFKFQKNDGGSICAFSRVFYSKIKINKDDIFWFLHYFMDVNFYSDEIFKYEE